MFLWVQLFLFVFAASGIAQEKVFRVRLVEDLSTLDWNYGEINAEVIYQIMEGLFRTNRKGAPEKAAVLSYNWNPEKTILKITLDPQRRWSDGSPLCAQQFVDSWNRLLDKKFGSPYAHFAHILKKFEAKSCRDLTIYFTRPSPEAPAVLSHYVFFPVRLDQIQKNQKIFSEGDGLFVNGPFRLKSWKKNQQLVLEKNPHYGGESPKIDAVEFLFLPDESTAQVLFEQNKLDWVKDIPALMRNQKVERGSTFKIFPSLTTFYFGLSDKNSLLAKNPLVRKALKESLSRDQLPKVLGREYRGTLTWVSPQIFEKIRAPVFGSQWGEARRILKEASDQGKMDLVLRVYNKSSHKFLAEWAQGQWEKKLGIRIPIEVQEGKVYWKEISSNTAPIFLSGVTAPYAHPRAFLQEFLSTSTANWTGWSSPSYDGAVNEDRIQEAEEILASGDWIIPLYTRDSAALVNPKWKGFHINPLGQAFLVDVAP